MLEAHWPRDEAVRECLKVDAESADPAVLLAVHQPMRLQRRDFGAKSDPEFCDEGRVLEALLAPTGDGRIIVPIVGNSGVGKSHVIRWLDAQLQVASGHENRIVVRISKGQSLKGVLGKLLDLEQMSGPRFQQIRERLTSARDKMSEDDAANLLCESLAQRVREASADARQEIQRGNKTELRRFQKDYGREDCLPWLLRDPALRIFHWLKKPDGKKGPISHLVEPFTDEAAADKADVRKQVLEPDDFLLDSTQNLSDLGAKTKQALGVMALQTPEGRKNAALVLNASLDDAKRTILGLESSVSELFDEVRTELLAAGKELVLLIEDFAVLSGMQKQLLQAVIREGIRDGKQVRCTLRTALAYTEGSATYLFDDTYRSRAKTEWLVPEEEARSFEEVLARASSLVAAYLNAARVGVVGLREALKSASRDERGALKGEWVPQFETAVSELEENLLESFKTGSGRNLFPLNQAALSRLIRENCQNGKLQAYNPRLILQGAVLKTVDCRHDFVSRPPRFPSATFVTGDVDVAPAVEDALRDLVLPAPEKQRLRRALAYWYGDARTIDDLKSRTSCALQAFGIEHAWLDDLTRQGRKKKGPSSQPPGLPSGPPSGPPQDPPPAPPTDPSAKGPIKLWEEDLSAWRSVNQPRQLAGERSTKLRTLIARSLEGAIDWQWLNLRFAAGRVEAAHKFVYLPNASLVMANLKPADALAYLCRPEDLTDASSSADAQETALALLRFFDVNGQSWDYDRAEFDAARYCGFVEAQTPQAMAFFQSRPMTAEVDPISLLASGLALSARCNGVPAAQSTRHEDLLAGMFDEERGRAALSRMRRPGNHWDDLTLALSTWSWGKRGNAWSDWLLDLVAARQGGEPLAINAGRLKAVLERIGQEWELLSPTAPVWDAVKKRAQEAGAIHPGSNYPDARSLKVAKALDAEAGRLSTWLSRVSAELGEMRDVKDMAAVIEVVEEALDACVSAGQAGTKVQEVRNAGSAVRPEDVPGLLAACRDVLSATDRGAKLAHRSRYDAELELKLTVWLDRISILYKSVEEKVAPAPTGNSPDPVAAEIEKQVEAVQELENEFQEGGQP